MIYTEITIVDFSVTEVGLEEQILAVVVDKEHPELEKQRSDLIRVQNESTIHLKQLEDRLLTRLASSSQAQVCPQSHRVVHPKHSPFIQSGQLSIQLTDIELIENLQATKASIESKVVQFIATEKEINRKRNSYRPVAAVSAMLYFIIDKLKMLDHMYQYSFLTFMGLVTSTIAATDGARHDEESAHAGYAYLIYHGSNFTDYNYRNKSALASDIAPDATADAKSTVATRPSSGRPSSGKRPTTAGGSVRPPTGGSSAANSSDITPKGSPGGSRNRVHQVDCPIDPHIRKKN